MRILLDEKQKFYKANLHAHSDYSDGRLSVEELKEAYKSRGYSIVAFTDHEHVIDNSRLNDEDFLTITSCEIAIKELPSVSTLKKFDMKVTHLNFYAKDPHNIETPCYSLEYDTRINDKNRDLIWQGENYERVYSPEGIRKIIEIANSKGFLVSYNHPTWSLENAFDYLNYEGVFAVEIYNNSCMMGIQHHDEAVWEDFLRAGHHVFCTANDDNHNKHPFDSPHCDSFGGWCMIGADSLNYDSIISSLENGNFYASTGAAIYSIVEEDGVVRVKTSPAKRIALLTKTRRVGLALANKGETITEAEFKLHESDSFFRIKVEGEAGELAFSQSYDL